VSVFGNEPQIQWYEECRIESNQGRSQKGKKTPQGPVFLYSCQRKEHEEYRKALIATVEMNAIQKERIEQPKEGYPPSFFLLDHTQEYPQSCKFGNEVRELQKYKEYPRIGVCRQRSPPRTVVKRVDPKSVWYNAQNTKNP
jgi:hypothetical protein